MPTDSDGGGWRPFTPRTERDTPFADLLRDRTDDERVAALDEEIARVRASDPTPKRHLAALLVLRDLIQLGWSVRVRSDSVSVRPHDEGTTPSKETVRRQLLHGRDNQLDSDSVRRFLKKMERPSRAAKHKSVINLIADGKHIAEALGSIATLARDRRAGALRTLCQPYLQVASAHARDRYTGLNLFHVWRYFRYTWSSRYRRSPGRHIAFLIRDAARPFHPVMAITSLNSAVLQLTARDEWIGWTVQGLLARIKEGEITDDEALAALRRRVREDLTNLYVEDLGLDAHKELAFDAETQARLAAIIAGAGTDRAEQLRDGAVSRRAAFDAPGLIERAMTPLFRAKRAGAARNLLRLHHLLSQVQAPLQEAVRDARTRNVVSLALRQIKQHFAASSIMDIGTCGAVPPYGPLLAGKLACLMMLTPYVREAVRRAYSDEPSVIASQMAGRPITRAPHLAMITTTSLYPERSSQYNRVKLPAWALADQGASLSFVEVGRSLGHGSTNLSVETEEALAAVAAERRDYRNVNYVFGEGQSAKMREMREAAAALGLSEADLVQHGSRRIVYVAPLIERARRVLLGAEQLPSSDAADGVEAVAEFWRARWLAMRLDHPAALSEVAGKRPQDMIVSRLDRNAPEGLLRVG